MACEQYIVDPVDPVYKLAIILFSWQLRQLFKKKKKRRASLPRRTQRDDFDLKREPEQKLLAFCLQRWEIAAIHLK